MDTHGYLGGSGKLFSKGQVELKFRSVSVQIVCLIYKIQLSKILEEKIWKMAILAICDSQNSLALLKIEMAILLLIVFTA